MIVSSILIVISIYLLISLTILPMQYRFLVTLKEEEAKSKANGENQGEMYEKMNPGKSLLHQNAQGNPLFLLANIIASIIYRIKHS
ncbi:flagellar basal body-associated protein FliL [Metabacillus crassostreae]|uniref:DUF3949 domain-containing protein n=1 Tax=Metabacillus crassostreae TaxID=929098 RepID=UPI00195774C0|nr:DUF3949 domain-containing protein [Metabacillus crassostreae]MBM7603734.1 flagellar basal body-associated protein FliL [Metabacillus crassostreae]